MKHTKQLILNLLLFGLLWAGLSPSLLAIGVDVGSKGFPPLGEREGGLHLGNTRVTFTGHSNGRPEVNQVTSYDPFGLVINELY